MNMKNNPMVGHPPGTVDEALSWLNRNACGEPGLHPVSLRESVRLLVREHETVAFLMELLRVVVKTGTKDPRLDARIAEELRSHE